VHVPLRPADDFDSVRGFAREIADLLVARSPDRLTTEQRKEDRGQRLYLDLMRNGYAQMAVAPYSVRARPGAPVATPLDWAELDGNLRPGQFTMATMGERLARQTRDPWAGMARHRRGLAAPRRRLAAPFGAHRRPRPRQSAISTRVGLAGRRPPSATARPIASIAA